MFRMLHRRVRPRNTRMQMAHMIGARLRRRRAVIRRVGPDVMGQVMTGEAEKT